MRNPSDFRRGLVKSAIVFIGMMLAVLASSIALRHWCLSHGQPKWEVSIGDWNRLADLALFAAWLSYVQWQRARAARE